MKKTNAEHVKHVHIIRPDIWVYIFRPEESTTWWTSDCFDHEPVAADLAATVLQYDLDIEPHVIELIHIPMVVRES